jgi:hypothetical protein
VIGTLIFADIPLATVGIEDAFWGWKDQCPDKHIWNKLPANEDQWSAQLKASNIWNRQPAADTAWQKLGGSRSSWVKQEAREEDHKKC